MTRPLTENIAWAAGLFEGEGTFTIKRKGEYRTCYVAVSMSDEDIIERFAQIMRPLHDGAVRAHQHSTRPHTKTMYTWSCTRLDGYMDICETFLPWLGTRRKAQALAVLVEWAEAAEARMLPGNPRVYDTIKMLGG